MAIVNQFLPQEIAFGARGGPTFFTAVASGQGGDESRSELWEEELGEWDLSFAYRTTAETEALVTFFEAVKGRAYAFYFYDYLPDAAIDDGTPRTVTVRFADDWLQIRRVDDDCWSWENVRLMQVRDEAA
jgi:uncharacterized protein (TIGR02217 family)